MDLPKTVTKEIFENLASVYWAYFSERALTLGNEILTQEALSILRLLNIEFLPKKNTLLWRKEGKEYYFSEKDATRERVSSSVNRVTPLKMRMINIEDIESILNREDFQEVSLGTSPLFDAIGYILEYSGSSYHISFCGSALFDAWREHFYKEDSDKPLNGIWKDKLSTDVESPIQWISL